MPTSNKQFMHCKLKSLKLLHHNLTFMKSSSKRVSTTLHYGQPTYKNSLSASYKPTPELLNNADNEHGDWTCESSMLRSKTEKYLHSNQMKTYHVNQATQFVWKWQWKWCSGCYSQSYQLKAHFLSQEFSFQHAKNDITKIYYTGLHQWH